MIEIYLCRQIPKGWHEKVESAVKAFVTESAKNGISSQGVDENGFLQQTLQSVSAATSLSLGGEFWLLTEGDNLVGYCLSSIKNDIDGKLTYWVHQAWVTPPYRGRKEIKNCWEKIRERAKECFCKHVVIIAGRKAGPFCRWLGKKYHPYATLLKEDLDGS